MVDPDKPLLRLRPNVGGAARLVNANRRSNPYRMPSGGRATGV
jgi:hypothetical protein